MGLRFGGGLEAFLNKNFSVRGDYILDYIPALTFKDKNVPGVKEKNIFVNSEFKLGLTYILSP